jgi:large subunit ribosomal protein L35
LQIANHPYIARLSATEFVNRPRIAMPKQKTHKGTKKRFRLTASGKAKHRQAGTSHLASPKTKKTRRNLRGTKVLSKSMLHQITKALGAYSS